MISPRFATMLCFVQTDAVLEAADRRPPARRDRQAIVRPDLGRRPALDQRHRDPDGQRRERRPRRGRDRGRAASRGGARRPPASTRPADRPRRRRAPAGSGGSTSPVATRRRRAGRPRRRRLAPRQDRAVRRRPQLGADRPGDRRRHARLRAGGLRHRDRGRRRLLRTAPPATSTSPSLAKAVERDEVEYAVRLPGEGAETELFFSDLSYGYVKINAEYTT